MAGGSIDRVDDGEGSDGVDHCHRRRPEVGHGIQKVAVLVGVGAGQRSRVGPGGGWFDWCRKEFGRLV